jgi:hypothetical protein
MDAIDVKYRRVRRILDRDPSLVLWDLMRFLTFIGLVYFAREYAPHIIGWLVVGVFDIIWPI